VAFYDDDVPVRKVRRSTAMGANFRSKAMSVYASTCSRYRVNYLYVPFVAFFMDLELLGYRVDPI